LSLKNESLTTLQKCRPLDEFAQRFLRHLDHLAYTKLGTMTDIESYVKTIKVFNCSDRFWELLLETRSKRMITGSPSEYRTNQPEENIEGLSFSAIGQHRTTGQRYWVPPEDRESWFRTIFPERFAHEFAPYDALVFLYKPDRWARKLSRERLAPTSSTEDFERAKVLTIAMAPYRVCAHECLHVVQLVIGGSMPTWNPTDPKAPDPAERLFDNFTSRMTLPIFEHRFVHRDGPQMDDIDV